MNCRWKKREWMGYLSAKGCCWAFTRSIPYWKSEKFKKRNCILSLYSNPSNFIYFLCSHLLTTNRSGNSPISKCSTRKQKKNSIILVSFPYLIQFIFHSSETLLLFFITLTVLSLGHKLKKWEKNIFCSKLTRKNNFFVNKFVP